MQFAYIQGFLYILLQTVTIIKEVALLVEIESADKNK